jgi:hypothetical protein
MRHPSRARTGRLLSSPKKMTSMKTLYAMCAGMPSMTKLILMPLLALMRESVMQLSFVTCAMLVYIKNAMAESFSILKVSPMATGSATDALN